MSKKSLQPERNFNLFEEPKKPEIAASFTKSAATVSNEPICPLYRGKARPAIRPGDHDGKPYYCVSGCVENGDNYYFTPSENPPESTLAIVKEVETEAVGEGRQAALIEIGEKWENEWKGMPEFKQDDLTPFKTIYVHFESRADMEKFAELVAQKIGLDTRSIWYPEAEIGRIANRRYVKK